MRSFIGQPTTIGRSGRAFIANVGPGLLLAATIAMAATFVTDHYGGSIMLYALLFGIAFNFLATEEKCEKGVAFSASIVLRFGVALLGLQIVIGDVIGLGVPIVMLVVGGVAFTLCTGYAIGRAFKLKSDQAILSAGAVAICGASAALAIASVLPRHKDTERNTILTVVGVTTLSTVAMIFYPILARWMGFDDHDAGIFIGATIHDIAQVVGAGYMISDNAGETATLVKLIRVACLVPTVMMVAFMFRPKGEDAKKAVKGSILPMFLVAFILLMLINSLGIVPQTLVSAVGKISSWSLVTAVAALGVKTSPRNIFAVGSGPIAAIVVQTLALAIFTLSGLYVVHFIIS